MSPFVWTLLQFALAAVGTVGFGVYLTVLADRIAHRSRLGTVFVGAVLLGALTSLSEIGTSVFAAWTGHAELAVMNALGSIAAQTVFIVVADLTYRRANLEHAAASAGNLMLCALLLLLIGLVLMAHVLPGLSFYWIHPLSGALLLVYVYGMRVVSETGAMPMWRPERTTHTDEETDREISTAGTLVWLWARFAGAGAAVAGSGVLLARSGIAVTEMTGLSESFVGALATGLVSSAPELITALTAVRIGALTLAISNIIGGNAFDVIVVAIADVAYLQGPIYSDAGTDLPAVLSVNVVMSAVVLLGLLRRERHGPGNIGLEGWLLFASYAALIGLVSD